MLLLTKKEKNTSIIINASNSSSNVYFGHFDGAEDIPQSYMLIFFTKSNTELFEVVLNFIYH